MSLLTSSRLKRASLASILVLALTAGSGLAQSVQSYVEQAVPSGDDSSVAGRYNSPLAAGTLTLQDVLEAHKGQNDSQNDKTERRLTAKPAAKGTATAPMLTPPSQSSTTGLMLSEGMRAVLQKVGDNPVTRQPTKMRSPKLGMGEADSQPVSLTDSPAATTAAASTAAPLATSATPATVNGVTYQPGQAPKDLSSYMGASSATAVSPAEAIVGQSVGASAAGAAASAAAPSANPASPGCDQHAQKWQKTCADAGYPATYTGHIDGETRADCRTGALHDFWVTNSCAPPAAASASAEPAEAAEVSTPAVDNVAAPVASSSVAARIVDEVAPAPAAAAKAAAREASAPAAVDGTCGDSADHSFEDAPSGDLCRQGAPSAVSGSGPWTWACSGANGGRAAACSAQVRVEKVDGACGSANGVAVSEAPTTDLCDAGVLTSIKGAGPWNWTCKGAGGGRTQSCIAPMKAVAKPVAAEVAPAPEPTYEAAPEPVQAPVQDTVREERAAPPVTAVKSAKSNKAAKAVAPVAAIAPADSAESDLCGLAAETLAYQMPDKDLCRAGSPSAVNGDGPWSWSCTDNEGRTSTCRTLSLSGEAAPASVRPMASAPVASAASSSVAPASPSVASQSVVSKKSAARALIPAEPASDDSAQTAVCGLAAAHAAPQAPTVELCDIGKASAVRGSGPWRWTCAKGKSKVACETPRASDGVCGPANGMALNSAPFAGLCAAGRPSGISGEGPWTWTCGGSGGGVSVSCAATLAGKVEGACGSAANMTFAAKPTGNLCANGTPSDVKTDGNRFTWACSGANGGAVSSCAAAKAAEPAPPGDKLDGLCGFANGAMALSKPVEGLCSNGTSTAVVGHGPWNWNCIGENGGMTVSCTAPLEPPAPIDGVCGAANGTPAAAKPQGGLCAAGVTGRVSGSGPWTWTCSGANGGAPASCIAPVMGKSGALPSLTTSGPVVETEQSIVAAAPAPSAGLTTPRLPTASNDNLSALDKKTLPSLASYKVGRANPSAVPNAASSESLATPKVPSLSDSSKPLTPPVGATTAAPALQEDPYQRATRIPGNHLELDPTISTVLFTQGSGNIEEKVLPTLNKLATVLSANPDARITLTAYADSDDSTPRDARRLSLTRALAVREYLTAQGVEESRIDVRAEGANTTSGYIDRVDVKVNN